MEMRKTSGQQGFTLVELLISLVIFGAVLAGVVGMFTTTGHHHTAQEMMVDLTQDLRAVKQLMVQELREAGCNPEKKGGIGFQMADTIQPAKVAHDTAGNSIHFTRDIDNDIDAEGEPDGILEPDGDADDPNEEIAYYRTRDNCTGTVGALVPAGDNTRGCLRRDTGGGGMPMMPNVTEFEVTYFSEGAQIVPAKNNLSRIDQVRVQIEAEVATPDKVSPGARTQGLAFRVWIRNA